MELFYHRHNRSLLLMIWVCAVVIICSSAAGAGATAFDDDFYITWAPDHVTRINGGQGVQISLDQHSGCGFASKRSYLYGVFTAEAKLVPGNSAGTVVALYLYSNQPNRDEVDIEFLGNLGPRGYIMQTNVFADGHDDREHRLRLWFDPAADFHTYQIFWNAWHVVFTVDGIVVREHRNVGRGVPFPRRQPMSVYASIWDGDTWATNGGKTKIDWAAGPFVAEFRRVAIDACEWEGNPRFCRASTRRFWWNDPRHQALLSPRQQLQLSWVSRHLVIYDYCADPHRPVMYPSECRPRPRTPRSLRRRGVSHGRRPRPRDAHGYELELEYEHENEKENYAADAPAAAPADWASNQTLF